MAVESKEIERLQALLAMQDRTIKNQAAKIAVYREHARRIQLNAGVILDERV